MKIAAIRTTPLIVPYKRPTHSSYGTREVMERETLRV